MELKIKGLDQVTAWVGSFVLGTICFGIFWGISKCSARKEEQQKVALAKTAEKILSESTKTLSPPSNTKDLDKSGLDNSTLPSTSRPVFGYTGASAPWRWMDLKAEWELCGRGKRQSPIDISGARENSKLKALKFHYQHGVTTFSFANSTLHGEIEAGSWLDVDGDRYDLKSVDFRTPGEHRINGLPYELEIQLHHQELSGRLFILSIQFTNGKPNSELKRIASALPRYEGETSRLERLLWYAFLPTKKTYWQYRGSLTYPPCTEDVTWTVLTSTVTASPSDIEAIAKLQRDNARPEQSLNSRIISRSNR